MDLTQMDLSPNLIKPGTMNQIREETRKDPSLMTLNKVVLGGWPSQKSEVPDKIRAYWDFRDEISVYDGVLFKSHQVIVPVSLRPELLETRTQIVAYEEPGNLFTSQECRQQLGKHAPHVVCVLDT